MTNKKFKAQVKYVVRKDASPALTGRYRSSMVRPSSKNIASGTRAYHVIVIKEK